MKTTNNSKYFTLLLMFSFNTQLQSMITNTNLSDLAPEIQTTFIMSLPHCFTDYKNTINTINSLNRVDKNLNNIINDSLITKKIITLLKKQQPDLSHECFAKRIKTCSAKIYYYNSTCLYLTMTLKHAQNLLNQGADSNFTCKNNMSVLSNLVRCNAPTNVIKELLDRGANPHIVDQISRCNALTYAVAKANATTVRLLLTTDIDPNVQEQIFHNTPLHIAVKNEDVKNVKLLLTADKINTQIINEMGKSPLKLAMRNVIRNIKNAIEIRNLLLTAV